MGDRVLEAGDVITIDGSSGEVFDGTIPGTTEVVPEARTLLAWADELGIEVGEATASSDSSAIATSPCRPRKVDPDDCLRAIAIKGFAQAEGVADAVLSTSDERRAGSSTSSSSRAWSRRSRAPTG